MSNTPDVDPVSHAAKFVAIFAALPVIFGGVALAVPRMGPPLPLAARAAPFFAALVLLVVAFGVHRRSIVAAWIGIGIFAAALAGIIVAPLASGKASYAVFFWIVLLIWPIRKLWAAKAAMSATSRSS